MHRLGQLGFVALLRQVESDVEEASHNTAFQTVLDIVLEEIANDRHHVKLAPRYKNGFGTSEMPLTRTVGWIDGESIFFSHQTSWGWIEEVARTRGVSWHFNWDSFIQEAATRYGAEKSFLIYVESEDKRKSYRTIRIPLQNLVNAGLLSANDSLIQKDGTEPLSW
jgi:hypothetical protein